jgi:rubrerythrin
MPGSPWIHRRKPEDNEMNFTLDEVFKMACGIERDGAEFYNRARKHAPEGRGKEALTELADWEGRHEQTFAQMAREIPPDKRTTYIDPDNEAEHYLQNMVAGKVFGPKDPDRLEALGTQSFEQIIRTAIGMEKDSIIFYLGVKDAVPAGADQVDRIIHEEMRHIRILSNLLDKSEE